MGGAGGFLPRKGSLIGFKGGSNLHLSTSRLPAFHRLKGLDSNGSLRTANSPKLMKKAFPLRQSRLVLKDQICDTNDVLQSSIDSQIHSKPLKTSSTFYIKSSERLNENHYQFITNTNHKDVNHVKDRHELSTPLLSDQNDNGMNQSSNDLNVHIDIGLSDEKESRVPLLSSLSKLNNIVISKKWNSCSQLDANKASKKGAVAEKSHKSNDNSVNGPINGQKFDISVKDWSKISLVDCSHMNGTEDIVPI